MNVCIVLDTENRRLYEHEEIKSLCESSHRISLVLIEDSRSCSIEGEQRKGNPIARVSNLIKKRRWFLLIDLEKWLAKKIKPETVCDEEWSGLSKEVSIYQSVPQLKRAETVYFQPIRKTQYKYDFNDGLIEKIKESSDVVVLLGFNKILTGEILQCARHGVLSFHHADILRYRGRPAGFHEWINNEAHIGTTLQRLTDKLDGGDVILQRYAPIEHLKCHQQVVIEAMKLKGNMIVEGLNRIEQYEVSTNFDSEGICTAKLSTTQNSNKARLVVRCILKNISKRYFN